MAYNINKLNEAQEILDSLDTPEVKRVKRERGLIERTEDTNKVVLMEDNRQVLFG